MPGVTIGSNEISPALYYGIRLLPDLGVGAALKWIRIQLAPDNQSGVGTTFGLDLAALYRIPQYRLQFGANLQNLGPSVTFINEDQASPLSRNLKVGGAWTAYDTKEFAVLGVYDFNQSLVTNDFRGLGANDGLDPFSIVCKVVSANGRPAVKLSDNPMKATGPAPEVERYRRVFQVGAQASLPVAV